MNTHQTSQAKDAGFTLLELIIYIVIVAVVLILSFGFVWNIIGGQTKSMVYREVQQNARLAMEKITRTLRAGENPAIFTVSDGVLHQNLVAITSEQVRVANLQFTPISNTYKINLTVEYKNPEGRSEYEASIDLESTVLPRQ